MYSEIESNKRKTVLLFVAFFALIGVIALMTSNGRIGPMITYLVVAAVYASISYFASSRIALSMNGAKQIQKRDAPGLWRTVENISITNGMPMPKVYLIQDTGLNAFATGRNPEHASVAITTGLLEVLDNKELEGVMAHEMGHIKNYDIRVSMLAFALVAAVSGITDMVMRMAFYGSAFNDDEDSGPFGILSFGLLIVATIVGSVVATMIQLAISRKREYLADATGAHTTRYPEGLARALEKIRDGGSTLKRQNPSTAHFFIANPLKGKSAAVLFSTHPPIEDRIAKLRSMGL